MGVDFRKRVDDLTYTANEDVLDDLAGWPTDLWMVEVIKYRKNTAEGYVELVRKDDLPKLPAGTTTDRLRYWMWQNRQVTVVPATENGLLQFDYLSILPDLTGPSSPLLIDMSVSVLAYRTAADAKGTRGQKEEAGWLMALAKDFSDKIVNIQVKNQQFVARRGQPEHGGRGAYNHPSGVI
ncbi:hypothetical protein LCGC14_0903370 [marine sediment metagenome]|uniref:Uncharacterized protein n=1 Tax=marine sediment metagenome TaxID=412755 RepID=A0A0F9S2L0_9ZZZZ